MMWGIGWGMPWFGWMLMVLVWVLVVAGVVWLVRALAGPRDTGVGGARRILDERFAAGEISADEYEARRAALTPARVPGRDRPRLGFGRMRGSG